MLRKAALFLSLCLLLTQQATAGRIERFVVVVPIYQELYNQNIATLIKALYEQDFTSLGFSKIDVYFVVNHTVKADESVQIENQETIEFLTTLARGEIPRVHKFHEILKAVANMPTSDRLNIHVLDERGKPSRNIGRIRDIGVKTVLASVPDDKLDSTLIAQMDGDTHFLSTYARSVTAAFEAEKSLQFALLNLFYADQPDSVARVYQRKITTDYSSIAHQFRTANGDDMPNGGGPRNVATAYALKTVGGVPHETVGEDIELTKRLKKRFPKRGRFLPIPVFANFRAREGSYDGKSYLIHLDEPIEFTDYDLGSTPLLNSRVQEFQKTPLLKQFYEESLAVAASDYSKKVRQLRNLIRVIVDERQNKTHIMRPAEDFPAILNNKWLYDLIDSLIEAHGNNDDLILGALTETFPYYLTQEPNDTLLTIFKLRAALQTLQIKPYLFAQDGKSAFLSIFAKDRPQFTSSYREYIFNTLSERWENLEPSDFLEFYSDADHVANSEIPAMLHLSEQPGYETLRPLAVGVANRYLETISEAPLALTPELEILAKQLGFTPRYSNNYIAAKQHQIKVLNEWGEILRRATLECKRCGKIHPYTGTVFNPSSFYSVLKKLDPGTTPSQPFSVEGSQLIHPMIELYQQGLEAGVQGFSDRLDARAFHALLKQIPDHCLRELVEDVEL
ncbi:hypothetical protein K2X33_07070 [bacterium]|nr:hypothetical protein [bacterium]